jgi:hypothetical protein
MKRLLFQKLHAFTDKNVDAAVHSSTEWNIAPSSVPFHIFAEPKEVSKNDWKDKDGDDEYVPDILPMQAYELDCTLLYKGKSPNTDIYNFLSYLAYGGEFKIYDERTGIGRTNVRFSGYDPDAEDLTNSDVCCIKFKIKLKVNDPMTQVSLTL